MKDVYYAPDESKQRDLLAQWTTSRPTAHRRTCCSRFWWTGAWTWPCPSRTKPSAARLFTLSMAMRWPPVSTQNISDDLVKEIAKRKPLRAVFRDSSYGSDSVKINVEQIFKLLSPATEIKSI